jgi:hypothetical protein
VNIVNEKTAKLISRYATVTGQPEKEIKRAWNAMTHRERAAERKRMMEEVGE